MRSRPLLAYFVLAFAITWGTAAVAIFAPDWFKQTFGELNASNPVFFVAVYAPTMLSIALTALFEGRTGLKALFARLDPRRFNPVWLLVVIAGFIGVTAIASWAGTLTGGTRAEWHLTGAAAWGVVVALLRDPGPLGEEMGWRGFALPRMMRRWSPTTASLILGVIWALWHLPAFYVSSLEQSQLSFPIFVLGATALSVVTCWLFLKTNGSVLIAILSHLMANHASDITGSTFNQLAYGLSVVAVVLIATGQMKPNPAAEHQPV